MVKTFRSVGTQLDNEQYNKLIQLVIIIFMAFLLRFLLATSAALDYDEAFTYAPAAQSYLSGIWTANIGHPMVMKLLFAGSTVLFGANGKIVFLFPWLPGSIGAIRLVSVIMGTLTVLVVYFLARDLGCTHMGAIIPCVVLAFDPISIAESSYGLLDPGMAFFYMCSVVFFLRYVKGGKTIHFYLSAVLFALSIASKYYAFIGIFVLLGILLYKRRLQSEWKSMAVFLWIVAFVVFAVQPYLWSSPLVHLSQVWIYNRIHLTVGQPVKIPGNPFLIPRKQLSGLPWPHVGSNPLSSKPDFYADPSQAVQSPWWYMVYIQAMYSTPFEILVYPLALYKICISVIKRRVTDLIAIGTLLTSVPLLYFALQTVRLPQYGILMSTSSVILTSIVFLHLNGGRQRYFLVSLTFLQVIWTLIFFLTSANRFTGWEFYYTPLTPVLAHLFHLLYTRSAFLHLWSLSKTP